MRRGKVWEVGKKESRGREGFCIAEGRTYAGRHDGTSGFQRGRHRAILFEALCFKMQLCIKESFDIPIQIGKLFF